MEDRLEFELLFSIERFAPEEFGLLTKTVELYFRFDVSFLSSPSTAAARFSEMNIYIYHFACEKDYPFVGIKSLKCGSLKMRNLRSLFVS